MTISTMGKKSMILGLALCLVLSSFHEVSCQRVEGSEDLEMFDDQLSESSLEKTSSKSKESANTLEDSLDVDNSSIKSEDDSDDEVGQRSSTTDEINDLLKAHRKSRNTEDESDGVMRMSLPEKVIEFNDDFETDSADERRKKLEEIERQIKAAAASKIVVEETQKKKSKLEESYEAKFEAVSASRRQEYGSKKGNGGSGIMGSLGIGQSGLWRCINENKNGVKEEEDTSIVIPKYELEDIIKEESIYQGSSSKTSSLIASLTQIVDKHKKGKWSSSVSIGKVSTKEKSETLEKLKVTLKSYRNIKVRELVTRSDFEEILTMAARYEELSSASVSYISKLSMYRGVIHEGKKASQRVQLAKQRVRLLKEMALEKQKSVDSELELVKEFAKKGDLLSVKIFAMKKLILKLEAEKEEVDMNFQKIVENLSRLIEEASQAYEEYLVVVRKWKEEEASEQFSFEAIESAEHVWVQFLGTL